jgi:hypothetical protein
MRFFNCLCGKNEENKPLLGPDDPSLQGTKDKGKAPLNSHNDDPETYNKEFIQIEIATTPKNSKEVQQKDTTQKYAQWFKYCSKTSIGTGFTSLGLLLCSAGISTHYFDDPEHPNIAFVSSLICYISAGLTPAAFILSCITRDYANKLLPSQEPQPPAKEVNKSQPEASSSNAEAQKGLQI